MLSPLDNRDTSAHQHRVPIKSVDSGAEFAEHLFNLNPTCTNFSNFDTSSYLRQQQLILNTYS